MEDVLVLIFSRSTGVPFGKSLTSIVVLSGLNSSYIQIPESGHSSLKRNETQTLYNTVRICGQRSRERVSLAGWITMPMKWFYWSIGKTLASSCYLTLSLGGFHYQSELFREDFCALVLRLIRSRIGLIRSRINQETTFEEIPRCTFPCYGPAFSQIWTDIGLWTIPVGRCYDGILYVLNLCQTHTRVCYEDRGLPNLFFTESMSLHHMQREVLYADSRTGDQTKPSGVRCVQGGETPIWRYPHLI